MAESSKHVELIAKEVTCKTADKMSEDYISQQET